MSTQQQALASLRRHLVRAFDESELKSLCFDFGVDYETLPDTGKENKARELLALAQRDKRLGEFISLLREQRPREDWPQLVLDEGVRTTGEPGSIKAFGFAELEKVVQQVVKWIEGVQNRDGGLPADDEGALSGTWATIGTLWAAWTAGSSFRRHWMRRALNWVLSQRNKDGGVPLTKCGDANVTDATAKAVICLELAMAEDERESYRKALAECLEWLLVHRTCAEGWTWCDAVEPCSLASTSYALRALCLARSRSTISNMKEDLDSAILEVSAWLRNLRNPDGGWGARDGDRSRAAVTALVALSLMEVDPAFEFNSSLSYLLNTQQPDGSWADTIERPAAYTVTRIGTPNCLQTLAASSLPSAALAISAGLRALLQTYEAPRFRYRDTVILTWPTRDALFALTRLGCRLQIPSCRHTGKDQEWSTIEKNPR